MRLLICLLLSHLISFYSCNAWSFVNDATSSSRRNFFQTGTTSTVAAVVTSVGLLPVPKAVAAPSATSTLIEELQSQKEKMEPIQQLLVDGEWDKVRNILKSPPVNKLWNLGDTQNTVLQLAKESGNVELFEMKDELALSLQMCDQIVYGNSFVTFQPGNGKVNVKEPQVLAKTAIKQIDAVIDAGK